MWNIECSNINSNVPNLYSFCSIKKGFCSNVKFKCSITLFGFFNKECVYSNVQHRIFLSIMKMFQFQLKRFKPFLVSNMFLLLQWKKIVTVTFFCFSYFTYINSRNARNDFCGTRVFTFFAKCNSSGIGQKCMYLFQKAY